MIDFAKITVRAGAGGAGAGSFRHIKGKRYGKADGGNGGRGGNLYIEATTNLNTLDPYRFVKDYQAQNGQNGLSNLRRGANGRDLVLKVPVGTEVKVGSQSYDFVDNDQQILLASGGQGGRGNAYLRDEFGRRPRRGEAGQPGEAYDVTLELKLIADVGLIGLPNAGKSTLLAALTAAHPAIAPYPFTTLEPNLGVLNLTGGTGGRETTDRTRQTILADIPGLIEGASEGKGLGHQFLRHIERTKVLVHLVEVTPQFLGNGKGKETSIGKGQEVGQKNTNNLAPKPNQLPNLNLNRFWPTYQAIRNELKTYSKELAKKKEIIVLTKIDLVEPTILAKIKAEFTSHRKKTIAVSAVTGEGLNKLVEAIRQTLIPNP